MFDQGPKGARSLLEHLLLISHAEGLLICQLSFYANVRSMFMHARTGCIHNMPGLNDHPQGLLIFSLLCFAMHTCTACDHMLLHIFGVI